MMLFLFADLLRKFICFLRVAEDVDPYGFDVYLSFIGLPIDCENLIVFLRAIHESPLPRIVLSFVGVIHE